MEIEHAIILALSEVRNYSNLFTEARAIRKENVQTLSKDAFNEALKRLYSDKIVEKKRINGREVLYNLNPEKSMLVKNLASVIKIIYHQICWVERFTKLVEQKAEEIDGARRQFIKMELGIIVDKDQLHHFVVREYQTLAMNLIRLTLSMQNASFFFTSKIWNTQFTKKDQLKQQKQYSEIIDRLVDAIRKLDSTSSGAIHTIIRKELSNQMKNYNIDMKRAEKLFTDPRGLYYESLS